MLVTGCSGHEAAAGPAPVEATPGITAGEAEIIDVCVCNLRIDRRSGVQFGRTVRGVGHRVHPDP